MNLKDDARLHQMLLKRIKLTNSVSSNHNFNTKQTSSKPVLSNLNFSKKKISNKQKSRSRRKNNETQTPTKTKNSILNLQKFKEKLDSGRFRMINEKLYCCSGKEAHEYFHKNPSHFDLYHKGYDQQLQSQPVDPLQLVLKSLLKKYFYVGKKGVKAGIKDASSTLKIGDFGCGKTARLAKELRKKVGSNIPFKVYSFDLIVSKDESLNDDKTYDTIIECDMAKVSLPDNSLHVAVYCLSLMGGPSLNDYLSEAQRVLKKDGLLKVIEVRSRFTNMNEFLKTLENVGFKLIKKNEANKMFVSLDFCRVSSNRKRKLDLKSDKNSFLLKPCKYKKR